MLMRVKKLVENAIIPTRAYDTDAGLDLYCVQNEVIREHGDKLIGTGIAMAIPNGWVAIVKEKSGIATKKKLTVGSSVVDSSFRGQLMVHLFNNSDIPATFIMGDKIAQLVIVPCWTGQPKEVESLEDTPRGDGGFGSTDKTISNEEVGKQAQKIFGDIPKWKRGGFYEFSMNDREPQCKYTGLDIKDCDCGNNGKCEFAQPHKLDGTL